MNVGYNGEIKSYRQDEYNIDNVNAGKVLFPLYRETGEQRYRILPATGQPELPAARLIVGETYRPSGNWSTYPPHKHEIEDLPREAYHEEMYYFKVNPAEGFGMTRFTNEEGDAGYTVQNDTILMIPSYHTVDSAPGYTTYYLWFLAGNHRVQAVIEEPNVGWVSRTVYMLKELGH